MTADDDRAVAYRAHAANRTAFGAFLTDLLKGSDAARQALTVDWEPVVNRSRRGEAQEPEPTRPSGVANG